MFNKSKYVYVMVVFFRRFLTQNWYAWYFLYHLFTFCDSFSAIIGSPLLFSTCYNSKCLHFFFFLESIALIHITMYTKKKKIITVTSPRYPLKKMWIWVLWILHFVSCVFLLLFIFFQRRSYKPRRRIIQPKNTYISKFK